VNGPRAGLKAVAFKLYKGLRNLKKKKPMTSSEIEPVTSHLAA
jgi:hypothetical protein